jgi:hypothetical protein
MSESQCRNFAAAGDGDSTWSNASKLSRKVRELAYRANRVLEDANKPKEASRPLAADSPEEVRDLRAQVARLQQKIHERRLRPLIPWIDSPRKKIENQLDDHRAGGFR